MERRCGGPGSLHNFSYLRHEVRWPKTKFKKIKLVTNLPDT